MSPGQNMQSGFLNANSYYSKEDQILLPVSFDAFLDSGGHQSETQVLDLKCKKLPCYEMSQDRLDKSSLQSR